MNIMELGSKIRNKIKTKKPGEVIAISFAITILIGAVLLTLPISNSDGNWFSFIDALFTSTSALCVTGLVVEVTAEQFSIFGQTIILILIQLGGLGIMTMIALIISWFNKKLGYAEKMVISEAINTDTKFELVKFLRFIIKYVFIFEFIGALLIMTVLIPEYGVGLGIYKSIFISISAFCNAGFDVIGASSLAPYTTNFVMNFTVTSLIIIGGIGFTVWFDLIVKAKLIFTKKYSISKAIRSLRAHTKLALVISFGLVVGGAVLIFFMESRNPLTHQFLSFPDQLMASYFSSVTLRTAGFATINPADMTVAVQFMMCIFMYIGGSPGGTAGGIKTTTFGVIALFIISELKGNSDTVFKMRTIAAQTFRKAVTVLFITLTVAASAIIILSITENAPFMDILFEVFSALGTVGLTLGLTPNLSFFGKIIIMILMFIGRIGPLAIVLTLSGNKKHGSGIVYPAANILIG